MAKGTRGPKGGRPGGRKDGAGIGPGPGYKPSTSGGGTRHTPGSSTGCAVVAVMLLSAPALAFLTLGYVVVRYVSF